jgi:adenylate cyclase
VSEQDFMGEVYATTRRTLLGCGIALLLTVLFSVVCANWITAPLVSLSREVRQIQEFKLDNEFKVGTSFVEVARLKDSLARMQTGLCSFRRFVPADLVRRILSLGEEARLGGETREVSVLFSDLRGYSTLSERLTPVEVIEFVNNYFQAMQEVIARHRGVVLELLGDAILVVFGAPDDLPDHAAAATHCALAMRDRLEQLNASLPVELGHRIGIHTGAVVAGNIGGHSYMKYGVIGDVVNVAARLEQLNKTLGTSVLVSEAVHRQLAEPLRARGTDQGAVTLKGRLRPQHVFSF